jgi:hypothetical protein
MSPRDISVRELKRLTSGWCATYFSRSGDVMNSRRINGRRRLRLPAKERSVTAHRTWRGFLSLRDPAALNGTAGPRGLPAPEGAGRGAMRSGGSRRQIK